MCVKSNRVAKVPEGMAAIRTRELPVLSKREKMDILKITSKILSASVISIFNIRLLNFNE